MKKFKKVTLLTLSLTSIIALASCKSARNSKTPTGSLNLTSTYASVKRSDVSDIFVTYNELYNKYRQNGYDTVLKELKKAVVRDYITEATYAKNYKSYNSSFLSAIYGTSSLDSFKDLLDSEREDLEEKVDSFKNSQLSTYGVTITDDEVSQLKSLISTIATLEDSDLESAIAFPESIITKLTEQYSYSVALTNYARDFVLNNYEKEKIYSYDDDKEITNSYQIDDEDIESAFKSTYYKYNQTKAIVIRFKTQAEALKFKEKTDLVCGALTSESSEADVTKWYATLYNMYYTTEANIDVENPFDSENEEKTVFYNDANNSHLTSNFSSDLSTFVYDALEDGEFITIPRNIDGQYYLVYRNKVNYYYGDGSGNDFDQVKDLTLNDLQDKLGTDFDYYKLKKYDGSEATTVSEYIKFKLIDSKASESLGDTLVTNILKYKSEIEIYDPVYENQFYNSYQDYYSLTSNFDNDAIFKIKVTLDNFTLGDDSDDKELAEYTYKVDDFFAKQDSIHGSEYATTLLEYKYLLNSDLTKILTDDELDSYADSAKSTVNSFKKNNTSYDKSMGLANYMVLSYGLTCTDSDAQSVYKDYLEASDLVSKYKTYYGYFVSETEDGDDDYSFVDDNNLFANLKKYADRTKDQYYNISANHVIIQVCPKTLGTTEDPRKYRIELKEKDEALVTKFDEGVVRLTKLIANELSVISDDSKDAMAKLVKTFNNVGYTYNLQTNEYGYSTWEDFKNDYPEFNYYLHSEDLGEITKSSAESYVDEFKTYLNSLVSKIKNDEALQDKINDDNGDGVLINPLSDDYKDLVDGGYCLTQYGYHILNVYSYTEASSCKFTREDDTASSSSTYKNWEHQKVTIDEKESDDTSDDMYAYASGYSSDDYASIEQLFIYFYQSNSSVTGLKSSISTAVSTYFSSVKSRYTNGSFQNYRLLQQMFGFANYDSSTKTFSSIKFYKQDGSEDTNKFDNYTYYITSVRTSVDSSKELESDDQFYGWFDIDWTCDLSNSEKYHY